VGPVYRVAVAIAFSLVVGACGDDGGSSNDGGQPGADSGTPLADAATGADAQVIQPNVFCPPLGPPTGPTSIVQIGESISAAVNAAAPNTTIHIENGVYDLSDDPVWIRTEGITLRSLSGNRAGVILEGDYNDNGSGGVINVVADNVTIADLSIRQSRFHAIHVSAGATADTLGTRIYNVDIRDPGEQAIKINTGAGGFADQGEVACSSITMSRAGASFVNTQTSSGSNCYTGGIDAHDARDWTVRDNYISGFWCDGAGGAFLSEHAVHFWTGSRDTQVMRNKLVDNARGIGFGLGPGGRSYSDDPCPGINDAGHYGGLIHNNVVVNVDTALFASANGVQEGIALWAACDATVLHNTVIFADAGNSAIEWRYAQTTAVVANNLTSHRLWARSGTATLVTNAEETTLSNFVDFAGLDLHITSGTSVAVDQGTDQYVGLSATDLDGDSRDASPDIGADELD